MNGDTLQAAIAALRDVDGDPSRELAHTTWWRVRRSLEDSGRARRRVSLVTVLAVLLGGTMSWALGTGRTDAVWATVRAPAIPSDVQATVERPPPVTSSAAARRELQADPRADVDWPANASLPSPPPPVVSAPPPPPAPPPAPRRAAPAQPAPPIEALYRRAHELHFRGDDHAAALAAWDAYLAAEPSGRFVVEARYNRALLLIRVGRLADARAALAPFASGDVEPRAYRMQEARELIERLDVALGAVSE